MRQMLAGLALPCLSVGSAQATSADTKIASILNWYIDILIPADDLTPAASDLGIADRVIKVSRKNALFGRLMRHVTNWLDEKTSGRYHELPSAQQNALVEWMSQAPWESPQRRFFEIVRDQAMWFYYAHPESWRGLPITRPPQPVGYVLE